VINRLEASNRPAEAAHYLRGTKEVAQSEIVRLMTEQGSGARGIIHFDRVGQPGHFINVENIGGEIWFYDVPGGFAVRADQGVFLKV
jgi:hypothetical protein